MIMQDIFQNDAFFSRCWKWFRERGLAISVASHRDRCMAVHTTTTRVLANIIITAWSNMHTAEITHPFSEVCFCGAEVGGGGVNQSNKTSASISYRLLVVVVFNPVYVNANPATDGPLPRPCPAASPWSATHTHRDRQLPNQNRPTNPREWSTIWPPTQGSKDTAVATFGKLLRQGVVHMGLSKHTDNILNGPKLNWPQGTLPALLQKRPGAPKRTCCWQPTS